MRLPEQVRFFFLVPFCDQEEVSHHPRLEREHGRLFELLQFSLVLHRYSIKT